MHNACMDTQSKKDPVVAAQIIKIIKTAAWMQLDPELTCDPPQHLEDLLL